MRCAARQRGEQLGSDIRFQITGKEGLRWAGGNWENRKQEQKQKDSERREGTGAAERRVLAVSDNLCSVYVISGHRALIKLLTFRD